LIFLNGLVFLYEVQYTGDFTNRLTDAFFIRFGVVPFYVYNALSGIQTFRLYTLITSMFIHAGILHIFGNMLFLFVFGDNVEDALGHLGYVLFYLVAGVGGAFTQVYFSILSGPPGIYLPSVGASAAISGVLAAYLVFFPRARIVSVVGYFVMPIRAFWLILVWFLLQVLYSSFGINPGVAYAAHLGGFAVGLVIGGIARIFVRPPEDGL